MKRLITAFLALVLAADLVHAQVSCPTCGNGTANAGETNLSCPQDIPHPATCNSPCAQPTPFETNAGLRTAVDFVGTTTWTIAGLPAGWSFAGAPTPGSAGAIPTADIYGAKAGLIQPGCSGSCTGTNGFCIGNLANLVSVGAGGAGGKLGANFDGRTNVSQNLSYAVLRGQGNPTLVSPVQNVANVDGFKIQFWLAASESSCGQSNGWGSCVGNVAYLDFSSDGGSTWSQVLIMNNSSTSSDMCTSNSSNTFWIQEGTWSRVCLTVFRSSNAVGNFYPAANTNTAASGMMVNGAYFTANFRYRIRYSQTASCTSGITTTNPGRYLAIDYPVFTSGNQMIPCGISFINMCGYGADNNDDGVGSSTLTSMSSSGVAGVSRSVNQAERGVEIFTSQNASYAQQNTSGSTFTTNFDLCNAEGGDKQCIDWRSSNSAYFVVYEALTDFEVSNLNVQYYEGGLARSSTLSKITASGRTATVGWRYSGNRFVTCASTSDLEPGCNGYSFRTGTLPNQFIRTFYQLAINSTGQAWSFYGPSSCSNYFNGPFISPISEPDTIPGNNGYITCVGGSPHFSGLAKFCSDPSGFSGTATVNVTGPGGYNQTFSSGGTSTAPITTPGTYVVRPILPNSPAQCIDCARPTCITVTAADLSCNTCPPNLQLSTSSTPTTCPGSTDGCATVLPGAGTGPFTYQWSNGGTNPTECGLSAGVHTVTVTDAALCTDIATVTVGSTPDQTPPAITCPSPITVPTNNGCAAIVNFTASATDNCGTPSITYSQQPNTSFPLGTTTVTAIALDASGNADTCSFTITVIDQEAPTLQCYQNPNTNNIFNVFPTPTFAVIVGPNNVAGWADNCGIDTATLSQTSFPCSQAGQIIPTVVTVTDLSGNVATCTVMVQVNGQNCNRPPQAVCQNITVAASANCQASVQAAQVDGGSSDPDGDPLSFSLSPAGPYPVGTTTVTLSVSDPSGALSTCTATITVTPPALSLSLAAAPSACAFDICCQGGTTSATATPSGGCAPVTYAWSNGATTATAAGLAAGTYTVTASDAAGQQATATITISEAPALAVTASSSPVSCPGASDGCASATASGGTGGYAFLWSNGATTATTCGLAAGTYAVTVTDAAGCTTTASATVGTTPDITPPLITCPATISGSTVPTACYGLANVQSGVVATDNCGPATITYSHPGGFQFPVGQTTVSATATDGSGNTASCTYIVDIQDNTPPTVACANLTVSPTATLPATVAFNQLGTASDNCGVTLATLSVNTFDCSMRGTVQAVTVRVEDAAGNADSCTALVTVDGQNCNRPPQAVCQNITVAASANCQASVQAAQVDGGSSDPDGDPLSYSLSPAGPYPVGTTTVTLSVSDPSGAVSSCTATITVTPPALSVSATAATFCGYNVRCAGAQDGSATALAIGGCAPITYAWSTGTGATMSSITGLGAGTYTVTATDATGQTATASITLTAPAPINLSANITGAGCNGGLGAIDLSVSGGCPGYTYLWSNGFTGQDPSGLIAGTYTVTVTDANGCTRSATYTVPQLNGGGGGTSCGPNGTKVLLCHYPPGNPANPQTLCISPNAVPAHLNNHAGDHIGSCVDPCAQNASGGSGGSNSRLGTTLRMTAQPNPISANGSITVFSPNEASARLTLHDAGGRLLSVIHDGALNEGDEAQFNLDASQLADGVYLLLLRTTDGRTLSQRLVIQH